MFAKVLKPTVFLAVSLISPLSLCETPMEAAEEMMAEASVADQQCGTTRQMAVTFDLIEKLGISKADLMREDLSTASNLADAKFMKEGRNAFCARIADETASKLHFELTK